MKGNFCASFTYKQKMHPAFSHYKRVCKLARREEELNSSQPFDLISFSHRWLKKTIVIYTVFCGLTDGTC